MIGETQCAQIAEAKFGYDIDYEFARQLKKLDLVTTYNQLSSPSECQGENRLLTLLYWLEHLYLHQDLDDGSRMAFWRKRN